MTDQTTGEAKVAPLPSSTLPVPTKKELLEFQPDAVVLEHRSLPGGARWTLYSILLFVTSLIVWASLADVDRIITARGKLITTAGAIVVQPLTTSVIRTLDAKVGSVVKADRTLATLDPTFSKSDVVRLKEKLHGLTHLVHRLRKELDGEPLAPPGEGASQAQSIEYRIHARRQSQYNSKIIAFDNNVRRLTAKLETNRHHKQGYKEHVAVLKDIETMYEKMARAKQGSDLKFLEARERRVENQTELMRLDRETKEIAHELAAEIANREAFIGQWMQEIGTELSKQRLERISVEEQLRKAQRLNSLVTLHSPVDAVVLDIAKRSVGSVIKEAETLITLVPIDVPLEAEVEISSKDIGRIRIDDPVRIKLDPFQYQRHGTIEGKVRTVSGDAFTREVLGKEEAFFRAKITLITTRLDDVPDDFRLLPGMTLTGEINIGKRKIISYFLYPVIRALDESIREP
uniref:Membrane fusion protein (MFP) family protein n=1 Tax=Candidatus Kentrum sp. SD TaxID=2126332 RepID=A0A450Y9K5_9GAMM|nr:MAG: HlyD family secretion protein [Candidatus Kentron sp. SD]VFK43044.1 MAG: HlyD family secretion protein [Candidatus Kentron sp. SD]VFK78615.1 MAG: HlyD family secretion protein [Candidatus Kentron sp. SD]